MKNLNDSERGFFTYEVKNSRGNYELAKTNKGKIIVFGSRKKARESAEKNSCQLMRILEITYEVEKNLFNSDLMEFFN